MKRLFYILTIVGMLTGFSACTDLLDTAPYTSIGSGNMWETENLADMGVAGIYNNLRGWGLVNGGINYGHYAFDQFGCMGQSSSSDALLVGNATPGISTFSHTWKRLYEGVHRANDAIANIPSKTPASEAKKSRLVAEAKFLRAFHYYRLNELFHGVPVYLEPIEEDMCTKGQETEEFVWEQIIKDLTDCINEPNLPKIDKVEGRATKGAAYAMRGKVYMQQKKWDLAAKDLEEVGKCGYDLFQGGYKELFTTANERCDEMIFSVQHIENEPGFGGNSQYYCGTRSSFGSCWNTLLVSPDGVDRYENADGTPFNWDNVIPGYTALPLKEREVFFIRDTQGASTTVVNAVNTRLNGLSAATRALYLKSGNEARIKKAYENRDPRLQMSVITPYANYLGVLNGEEQLTTSRWPMVSQNFADLWTDTRTRFYYLHRKFVYEGNGLIARDRCPTDEPLIRYADVLLMWAEALVELNKLSEAAEKVNMVRGRKSVEMPPVKYSNQSELREKVRHERRVEFMNEGVNFFDEMRWKTWKETKFRPGNGIAHVWGLTVTLSNWVDDYLYVWPVPLAEVQKNPNLKPTPGWIY